MLACATISRANVPCSGVRSQSTVIAVAMTIYGTAIGMNAKPSSHRAERRPERTEYQAIKPASPVARVALVNTSKTVLVAA